MGTIAITAIQSVFRGIMYLISIKHGPSNFHTLALQILRELAVQRPN